MPDFNVRSDSVNVEQIMEQIRARIREKRGVDYTEQQIRELAAVKLEKFLDPKGVRSDLLAEFQRVQAASAPPAPPNYAFGEATLFETHRGGLRFIRRLLMPLLKLFFNPNPLIQALHIQSELNTLNAQRETARRGLDQLHFEVLHNLVLETTRMSIEIKNLKMRVESLSGRLDFNERRARALESVVAYRPAPEDRIERLPSQPAPAAPPASAAPASGGGFGASQAAQGSQGSQGSQSSQGSSQGGQAAPGAGEGPGQRSRRRRRRRGRRGGGSAAQAMGGQNPGAPSAVAANPDNANNGSDVAHVGDAGGPAEDSYDPSTGSGSSRAESRDDEPEPGTPDSGPSEDQ